jgi:SAM-dependent methyltransferase
MHLETIRLYDEDPEKYYSRHIQCVPIELYRLAEIFFHKGMETIDLGCGIGRDTQWLSDHGFPTIGVEPSSGMISIARERLGEATFLEDSLPALSKLESGRFYNVFVSAVLMHVPRAEIISAINNILRIQKSGGRGILSWRHADDPTDKRLFEPYQLGQVARLLESLGAKVLYSNLDRRWMTIVFEKITRSIDTGVARIQSVISQEKKTSTYKFALLRALCEISRYEDQLVTWDLRSDSVLVPLKRVARYWAVYYLPLLKAGVKQTTNRNLAFAGEMLSLGRHFLSLHEVISELDASEAGGIEFLLKKVSATIKKQPMRYSGDTEYSVFSHVPKNALQISVPEDSLGMIKISSDFWRDLATFSFWIEDSIILQWAAMTEKMNPNRSDCNFFSMITEANRQDQRSTEAVRKIFEGREPMECVWTGKRVHELAIDHMIPWSLWRNNSLWNLLPSTKSVNSSKSNQLPDLHLIKERFPKIREYWRMYLQHHPELFTKQVRRNLGLNSTEMVTGKALEAIELIVLRLNRTYGTGFWTPDGIRTK